jgi:tetratricopeptide (TPR) repeat protein
MTSPPRGLDCSLYVPDVPAWHHKPHYSQAAAVALTQSYHQLKGAAQDADAYRAAYCAARPLLERALCSNQRMNAEFVLAQCFSGEGDFPQALQKVDAALELASWLHDVPAAVVLNYLGGGAAFMLTEFELALSYYASGLLALRTLDDAFGSADPRMEADILINLTSLNFELADYNMAWFFLNDAHENLLRNFPSDTASHASVAWLRAQLLRWNGQLDRALTSAVAAADAFATLNAPLSSARIHTIAADIALDLAESFGPPTESQARRAFVTFARTYAQRALPLARSAKDPIGTGLVHLSLRRCDLLAGRPSPRIASIESLARKAKHLGDVALAGRAQAALGDEFAARQEWAAAKHCYLYSWRLLEEHALRAMAKWPHRGFLRMAEFDR